MEYVFCWERYHPSILLKFLQVTNSMFIIPVFLFLSLIVRLRLKKNFRWNWLGTFWFLTFSLISTVYIFTQKSHLHNGWSTYSWFRWLPTFSIKFPVSSNSHTTLVSSMLLLLLFASHAQFPSWLWRIVYLVTLIYWCCAGITTRRPNQLPGHQRSLSPLNKAFNLWFAELLFPSSWEVSAFLYICIAQRNWNTKEM